jgi:myo-inositol-1(or 4)-monophosphatase
MQTTELSPEQIEAELTVVTGAFKDVAPEILAQAGNPEHAIKSNDGSPVTETDVRVEAKLKETIGHTGTPIYGEEGGYANDMVGTFWLIDPIDGTRDFIENIPHFTTMGVLIQNDEAVAAAIYNPSTDEMYTAIKGRGAYKNGERLNVATMPVPPVAWCKTQFAGELTTMLAAKDVICQPAPRGGGFGFTKVADGTAAARFNLHSGGYTHDYAPGALLAHEAGCAIIPVLDNEYTYKTKSFVVCHPEIAPLIQPHVQRLRELEALKTAK